MKGSRESLRWSSRQIICRAGARFSVFVGWGGLGWNGWAGRPDSWRIPPGLPPDRASIAISFCTKNNYVDIHEVKNIGKYLYKYLELKD